MSRNNDYTIGKLLYGLFKQNCYKLIDTDLSRQANTSIPQQINFIEEFEEDNGAAIIFITKSSKKLF